MERRSVFSGRLLPWLLLAPQLAITLVFFFWPAAGALLEAVRREDAFGLGSRFVGIENFARIVADPAYLGAIEVTLVFSLAVAALALAPGLLLAVMADRVGRGARLYRTVLLLPY